jgi:hypothetical protein
MTKKAPVDHERIAAIRRRLAAASEGPWIPYIEGRNHTSGSSFIKTASGGIELDGATDADIEFMAEARQDVAFLLDELQRLADVPD